MLEILEFIFQNFWTWAGTLVLIAVLGFSLSGIRLFTINIRRENKNESKSTD